MKFILASSNEHKAKEINEILNNKDIEILTLKDIHLDNIDIIENGKTFKDNAFIKAREIKKHTDLPVIADDSGLCIDALDGFPSINTARYAKEMGGYDEAMNSINNLLLNKDKSASFKCVICLLIDIDNPLYFEGEVKGHIAPLLKGDNGFGYDPIFVPNGYDKPFSLLDSEIKNSISHRYKAIEQFKNYIKDSF